jgi:hypothetical protein
VGRALRWDGIIPSVERADGKRSDPTPDDVRAIVKDIQGRVGPDFEVIVEIDTSGRERTEAAAIAADYAAAGTTWWLEPVWQSMYEFPGEVEPLRARIAQGPF